MKFPGTQPTRTLLLVVMLLVAVLTGACSTPPTLTVGGPRQSSNWEQYIGAVEQNAARNNTQVYWVHPPDEDDLDEYTPTVKPAMPGESDN